MPVIKSAKKKLRRDAKRELINKMQSDALKKLLKKARKNPSSEIIQNVFSYTDKAVKNNLIHKNKAARIKSAFSKLIKSEAPKVAKKTEKQSRKKVASTASS